MRQSEYVDGCRLVALLVYVSSSATLRADFSRAYVVLTMATDILS